MQAAAAKQEDLSMEMHKEASAHLRELQSFHTAWAWWILSQDTAKEYGRNNVRTTWGYLREVLECK